MRPVIQAKAEAHARVLATTSINQAIREKVAKNIRYEDLISVKVDNRGRVVLMQPNTGEINRLASDATITVQQLMKTTKDKIYLPLGQLLGSQLLAGRGPDIPIVIVPVGTVESRVYDVFEEAGINQTRHKIYLEVKTMVRIVVPLLRSIVEIRSGSAPDRSHYHGRSAPGLFWWATDGEHPGPSKNDSWRVVNTRQEQKKGLIYVLLPVFSPAPTC